MSPFVRLSVLLLAPTLALAAPPTAPPSVAPEPGVEWENTVEMQMAGFSMPAQTTKSCVPKKGMTGPPGAGKDDSCKATNVKNDGKRMSWSMVCEKEKMTGEGEITQTADGYDGKMTMTTKDGEMVMKMRGKKLGTPCDAATIKRQMVAIQAETAASIAENCRSSAKEMQVWAFTGTGTSAPVMCKDPADVAILCDKAATRDGIWSFLRQPDSTRSDLGVLCKKDFSVMKAQSCAVAGKEEKGCKTDADQKLLSFIGDACPAQTQVIAQRECAGRTYTELQGTCWYTFCTHYAANLLAKDKPPAAKKPKAEDSPEDAAKKAVKSLLPF